MSVKTEKKFILALTKIHKWKKGKLQEYNQKLRRIILDAVSEGECNVDAVNRIEISELIDNMGLVGFKIVNKPIFLIDIYELLYTIDIPEQIKEYYPSIQEKEWKSTILMIIALLKDLSRPLGLVEFYKDFWLKYEGSRIVPRGNLDDYKTLLKDMIQIYANQDQRFSLLRDNIYMDIIYDKSIGEIEWGVTFCDLKEVLIMYIMHKIELLEMPDVLVQKYPLLSEKDWEASTRIMFFIFSHLTAGGIVLKTW